MNCWALDIYDGGWGRTGRSKATTFSLEMFLKNTRDPERLLVQSDRLIEEHRYWKLLGIWQRWHRRIIVFLLQPKSTLLFSEWGEPRSKAAGELILVSGASRGRWLDQEASRGIVLLGTPLRCPVVALINLSPLQRWALKVDIHSIPPSFSERRFQMSSIT